jgi:hypothetical protein
VPGLTLTHAGGVTAEGAAAAAVDRWCEERTRAIHAGLGALGVAHPVLDTIAALPPRVGVVVASHLCYLVSRAAAEEDEAAAGAAFEATARVARVLETGRATASRADSVRVDDPRYGSPVVLPLRAAPLAGTPRLADAVARLEDCGMGGLLDLGLRLLVVLDPVPARGEMRSYTIRTFPGIVWTEDVACDIRLAEAIAHESAHASLNLLLAAADVTFPADLRYFSPWKGVERPAFGLVHAAFAFSTLCGYWAAAAGGADDEQRRYCEQRRHTEAEHLRSVRPAVLDALRYVEDTELRDLLTEVCVR